MTARQHLASVLSEPQKTALAEVKSGTFPLLTVADLMAAPPPRWLVDELMPVGMGVIHGAPATFKSFVALDWALSVAAGLPWHGHDVQGGWVVYVAAEGRGGMGQRVAAWMKARGVDDVPRFRLLADTVNLLDTAAVAKVSRTLHQLGGPCSLLVIDTMARSMPGGEENGTRDVGMLVAAVDALRGEETALIVHHDKKDGTGERGSGALRGAADFVVGVERKGSAVTLKNTKMKEAAEWPARRLVVRESAESLVLDDDPEAGDGWRPTVLMARVAEAVDLNPGMSQRAIRDVVKGKNDYIDEALRFLIADGFVRVEPGARNAQEHHLVRPYEAD